MGRHEGGPKGQPVSLGTWRALDYFCERQAPGNNRRARASAQYGLGRCRRQDPLLVRENRSLSHSIQDCGNSAVTAQAANKNSSLVCNRTLIKGRRNLWL